MVPGGLGGLIGLPKHLMDDEAQGMCEHPGRALLRSLETWRGMNAPIYICQRVKGRKKLQCVSKDPEGGPMVKQAV